MVQENVWVELQLCSGSMGSISDIIWDVGAECTKDPSLALPIDFGDDNQKPLNTLKTRKATASSRTCFV